MRHSVYGQPYRQLTLISQTPYQTHYWGVCQACGGIEQVHSELGRILWEDDPLCNACAAASSP